MLKKITEFGGVSNPWPGDHFWFTTPPPKKSVLYKKEVPELRNKTYLTN